MSTQLVILVGLTKLPRWRCRFEVQERDSHEEEGEEEGCYRRAEGASVVVNGNKAAVPLGGSGNSMRRNITNIVSVGDASVCTSVMGSSFR